MWYAGSDKVRELVEYSNDKFGIEIPLAKEVSHMSYFCWDLSTHFNRMHDWVSVELEKPKKGLLKWCHFYGTGARTETLEIPESVVWEIQDKCVEILNDKCEELAEMCGWYKTHPKEDEMD